MRPDLASAQAALLSFITGRDGGAPSHLVLGDHRASSDERLHVYAYMYRARLFEALEAVYPRLARHLGHEAFQELALAYVGDHPSRHPSLRFLGARLPDWLEEARADAPWLADLARLEWARDDVFDAADERLLTMDDLRALPPEAFGALALTLIGAHRVVTGDHATAALWDAVAADEMVDAAQEADESRGEVLLVWRQDAAVYHRPLAADEAEALEQVAAGATFGAICDRLAARLPAEQAAARAFAWLSTWTQDGLLAAPAPAGRD